MNTAPRKRAEPGKRRWRERVVEMTEGAPEARESIDAGAWAQFNRLLGAGQNTTRTGPILIPFGE